MLWVPIVRLLYFEKFGVPLGGRPITRVSESPFFWKLPCKNPVHSGFSSFHFWVRETCNLAPWTTTKIPRVPKKPGLKEILNE